MIQFGGDCLAPFPRGALLTVRPSLQGYVTDRARARPKTFQEDTGRRPAS